MSLTSRIRRYYLFEMFGSMHFFSAVLVPFFLDWGKLNLLQVQLLQSWFMVCVFLLEVPTGAVADKYGRKVSIVLGTCATVVGTLIYGTIPHLAAFLLGELILALSIALISGADEAWLYDTLKSENQEKMMKKIVGRVHVFSLIGIMIAGVVGSVIGQVFGINAPMYFTSLSAGVALVFALQLPEPKIAKKQKLVESSFKIAVRSFKYFAKHAELRILALNVTLVATAAYFVIWLYQPLLQQLNVPLQYFGLFHAALVLSEMLVAFSFEKLERLVGSAHRYLALSAAMVAVSFLFVAVWPNMLTVGMLLVLGGGFGLTRQQFASAHMHELVPSETRAAVISSISMFRRLGTAIANPVVGLLALQGLGLPLVCLVALPVLAVLIQGINVAKSDQQQSPS